MVLGPGYLQEGQLNTWEAEPVSSTASSVSLVWQWIPGDKEGIGSTVTLTGLADGEHELLLRARDRAGNLSPSSLQVNWTVDTTAPSNCSVSSFNGAVVPGWTPQLSLHRPVNSSVADVAVSVSSAGGGSPLAAVVYSWRSRVGGTDIGAGGGSAGRAGGGQGGGSVSLGGGGGVGVSSSVSGTDLHHGGGGAGDPTKMTSHVPPFQRRCGYDAKGKTLDTCHRLREAGGARKKALGERFKHTGWWVCVGSACVWPRCGGGGHSHTRP